MAFPVWRRGKKKVYVYYYNPATGKLTQLPRDKTEHLDGLPREDVEKWVQEWEVNHGIVRERSDRINLKDTDKLNSLWIGYQTHQNLSRGRRDITSQSEDQLFRTHILDFFVGKHSVKLPAKWHSLIAEFHAYLFEQKLAVRTIQKVLWALERFGKHLVWQQYMEYPFVVSIPAGKHEKVTPLKVRKTPDEIIKFAKGEYKFPNPEIDYILAVLIGYFGALGPGELFGLEKADFLTGTHAETNTKTLSGFRKHGLGSKLSIMINKTLPSKGKQTETIPLMKNDYRYGIVNIWHSDAAKLIAKILSTKPEGRLFPFAYGHFMRRWRENLRPILGMTSHDLRRASGLYLGRTARIDLTLLQEHMRHAEIETSMLYTREPLTPEITIYATQNFDDVA